jgi:hypothetical protein
MKGKSSAVYIKPPYNIVEETIIGSSQGLVKLVGKPTPFGVSGG